MRILGVDPGGSTGLATVDTFPTGRAEGWDVNSIHVDFAGVVAATTLYFDTCRVDAVACEKYTISPRTLSRTRQTDALEVTGWVRGLCLQHGIDFVQYSPADAKIVWSDERLKINGFWIAKADHQRDALRQALLYLQRHGATPPVSTV